MTTNIPSLTALPPAPDPDQLDTFEELAYPFTAAVRDMVAQQNATIAATNQLANELEGLAVGGAAAVNLIFSSTTADADPGAGTLRLNSATQNAATQIFVDLADSLGTDITALLDSFDDSTNTVKGSLRLAKSTDGTKWLLFNITAVTVATGYRKLVVALVGSSALNPFANGDTVNLVFTRNGDKGDTVVGPKGDKGDTGASGGLITWVAPVNTNGSTAVNTGEPITAACTRTLPALAGLTSQDQVAYNIRTNATVTINSNGAAINGSAAGAFTLTNSNGLVVYLQADPANGEWKGRA